MVNQKAVKTLIISSFLISLVLIVGKVYGQNLEISGNAASSNNSININQTESNTVNQSNSVNVNNSVNAESDTGGNSIDDSVDGGSITTGDATSNVNINNQFNTNKADVKCKNCTTPTPTPKPSPSPTPKIGGAVSDPGSAPSDNGGNASSGNGDNDGSSVGDPGQTQAVLGLSSTSGDRSLFNTMAGFLLIFLGYTLVRRNAKA